jgi:hypothetical protein
MSCLFLRLYYAANTSHITGWGYGSMVELSTPNRKVAGSIPVGLSQVIFLFFQLISSVESISSDESQVLARYILQTRPVS